MATRTGSILEICPGAAADFAQSSRPENEGGCIEGRLRIISIIDKRIGSDL